MTAKLLNDGVIASEECEIVAYGLENIINNFIGIFISVAVGCLYKAILESMILWMCSFPLRKNAGGYHAKTKIGCIVASTLMLIISFQCIFHIKWNMNVYNCMLIIFAIIIFFMAPIENHNKYLDKKEFEVYRKRTRIILMIETLLYFIFLQFSIYSMCKVLTLTFFIVVCNVILGKLDLNVLK